jgi:hypothetical protein
MKHKNELDSPPIVDGDDSAFEVLRVWVAQGDQHVSIAGEIWNDPAAWGILLVDLAQHVANMYEHSSGRTKTEVLQRIREGIDAEWAIPTDTPHESRSE